MAARAKFKTTNALTDQLTGHKIPQPPFNPRSVSTPKRSLETDQQ